MRKMRLYALLMAGVMVLSSTGCASVGTIAQGITEISQEAGIKLSKQSSKNVEDDEEPDEASESDETADTEVNSDAEEAAAQDEKNSAASEDKAEAKSDSNKESNSSKDEDKSGSSKSDSNDADNSGKISRAKDSSSEKSGSKSGNKTDEADDESDSDDDDSKSDGKASDKKNNRSGKAASEDEDADDKDARDTDEAKASVLDSLPKVGDSIHGFTVTDISDYELKNAKIVSMTHEKSGASLIYIACDDIDKAVGIFFKTVAENDKGLPHIFEHSTLAGSGKYPNSNIFMDLADNCYNTYMNAATWQEVTGYEMSSLSDKQLIKIMDLYMAGLVDPLALKDENVLGQEAYRFSMSSLDDDITVTGAVFNEMEAANADLESFAYEQSMKVLYPGSRMSYNSGGYRNDIITVTHEELKSYHDKYYHPSNMLIALYGDLDYEEYLEVLDEDYLSDYDKKDITIEDSKYIPWTGEKYAVVDYPVTEDASAEDSGEVLYNISLGNMSAYDTKLMSIIASILSADSSPITKSIKEQFPTASFSAYVMENIDQPALLFALNGTNAGDGKLFRQLINEGIEQISKDGLDKDLVDSMVDNITMEFALMQEQPGGIGSLNEFANSWTVYGESTAYLDKIKALTELEETAKSGTLDTMVDIYLYEPMQSAVTEVNPKPGLAEANDEAFAQLLKDKKDLMSKTEQAKLVGSTAEYDAWIETQADASKYLDELCVVDVDELPEEVQNEAIVDEETSAEGIRELSSELEDAIYLKSALYLKADTLDYDEIHDMVFLGELFGKLETRNYTRDEFYNELRKTIYDYNTGLDIVYDDATGEPQPYFKIDVTNMADKTKDAYALISEMLNAAVFTDTATIKQIAAEAALDFKNSSGSYILALNAGKAAADANALYEYHAESLDYYNYLTKVSKMSDKQLKSLAKELEAVLGKLLNTNGAIYTAVGDADAIKNGKKYLSDITGDFTTTALPSVDYSKELAKLELPKSIAVAVNDTVSYNGYVAANSDTGIAGDGTNDVCMNLLYSQLFFPTFRYNIGAYGCMQLAGERDSYMLSYRDPMIKESFEAIEAMPSELEELELTETDIDNSILVTYSTYAYPASKSSLASREIDYILQNKDTSYTEECLANMKMAKSVTAKDVREFAKNLQSMIDDGVRITAGSSANINKNKELYDLVITDLVK